MDYEKKYKEALERVRRLHDRMLVLSSTDALVAGSELEFIFPELTESEDERIRIELKEAFEAYDIESTWNGIPIRSIFAWLEKQKEQKPAECIEDSVKFEEGFKAGRESGLRDGQKDVLNNLDSYGLCKPAEWSEEDEKRVKQLIYDTEHIRAEYEKRNKELGESFNDELIKDCDEQIAWLKALSLNHKKFNEAVEKLCSNEWSKEDEEMRNALWNLLKIQYPQDYYMTGAGIKAGKFRDWLKSLRPSWKHSEHQMNILKAVKEYVGRGSGYWGEGLGSLIEDLEKL